LIFLTVQESIAIGILLVRIRAHANFNAIANPILIGIYNLGIRLGFDLVTVVEQICIRVRVARVGLVFFDFPAIR
jgi:hypothetical protein